MTDGFLSAFELAALWLSMKVALWAISLSLPIAFGIAYILARHHFFGHGALNAVVHLPLVLPPVVVGYGLLLLFSREGVLATWLGQYMDISLAFTWKAAAIASAVMAFPLMVRAIRMSIESIEPGLEAVAQTLGASRWRIYMTIILPLSLPGILTGAVLGFARSLGEFGATITFAANIPGQTQTLPLALFSVAESPGNEAAAARLAILGVVLALAALVASEILARRLANRLGQQARYSP